LRPARWSRVEDSDLVADHNRFWYRESIPNLTPANACFDRAQTILPERERIKRHTIKIRHLRHRRKAA
jgi:hypothetical protein